MLNITTTLEGFGKNANKKTKQNRGIVMNLDILLKNLKVSRKSCEIILETFVLNTDAFEFQTLKAIIEAKNKRELEEIKFLQLHSAL